MSNQPPTDKEQRFIQMRESLRENERMICLKLKNAHAHPIEIGVEPRGLYDMLPAKTTWEYIGIVSLKDEEDLVIQIDDHDKITIWDEARGEIFDDKGNHTLIRQPQV